MTFLKPLITTLVLSTLVLCICLMAGMEPSRAFELTLIPSIMAAPFLGLCLVWPRARRFAWIIYALWCLAWSVGLIVELFIQYRYRLVPQSQEVMDAIINSPAQEVQEYMHHLALPLAILLLACSALAALMAVNGRQFADAVHMRLSQSRWRVPLSVVAIVLPLAAHANVVVEWADPVTFWPSIVREGVSLKAQSSALAAERRAANRNVAAWAPVYTGPDRKTVVLVLGESSNRWNWSLYGYSRKTTPELDAMRGQFLAFDDVVSSYGNTIKALTRALTIADHNDDESWRNEPSVLGLARASGYKVFWLTNQSTAYFEGAFGGDADRFRRVYAGRAGRHDSSFDERLLPVLDDALADPSPRKLIVLHMLGSHEDYSSRYPAEFDRFGKQPDQVAASMSNRWWWVRDARDAYDNSILYTDHLLAAMLKRLKAAGEGEAHFLYVSDHAQDVGHLTTSYGHQFFLESGFTVPMIYWSNRPGFPTAEEKALEARSFETDELDWTLLPMLSIRTNRDKPEFDILGARYQPWQRIIAGKPYVPGKSHRGAAGEAPGA